MGLAATSAMPIAVAALLCAPLAAQTRPSENNPKRLIEKADRLAWLYNWYLAGPLYADAVKLFEEAGDSRNALYAKIGRLRSEWETMSFPDVSEYLATELDSAVVQNDPQLRLWILDAKGAVDLEVNVASARRAYEEARDLARKLPVAPWTAIGASGSVDESSIPLFGFTNASAGYGPNGSIAPLEFRYNVVNTQHFVSAGGGIPTVTQPGWTTLEFGAQAPATSTATAYLYRVNRCTGQQALICQVRHANQAAPGACRVCQFPNTAFNFTSYLYYVRVVLDRNTANELPMAHTLRIY